MILVLVYTDLHPSPLPVPGWRRLAEYFITLRTKKDAHCSANILCAPRDTGPEEQEGPPCVHVMGGSSSSSSSSDMGPPFKILAIVSPLVGFFFFVVASGACFPTPNIAREFGYAVFPSYSSVGCLCLMTWAEEMYYCTQIVFRHSFMLSTSSRPGKWVAVFGSFGRTFAHVFCVGGMRWMQNYVQPISMWREVH